MAAGRIAQMPWRGTSDSCGLRIGSPSHARLGGHLARLFGTEHGIGAACGLIRHLLYW